MVFLIGFLLDSFGKLIKALDKLCEKKKESTYMHNLSPSFRGDA